MKYFNTTNKIILAMLGILIFSLGFAFASTEGGGNNTLPFVILPVFLGFSALLVYFIQRKKKISQKGDDFELID